MRKLFSVFILLQTLLAMAQPTAHPLEAGQTAEGLVYFLPKTVFHFHVRVERMVYQPGEFSKYAEKYLRLADIQQDEETIHNIIGIDITQSGIRDTSKCYVVNIKGGKWQTAAVSLSDDGVLLAINDAPLQAQPHQPFKAAPQLARTDPHRFLSAEVFAAGSTAKMAELTAAQMQELQQRRQQLIMGDDDEQPKDERQLRLLLTEIDREYDALLTLFTGTISRDTTEHTLTVCPEQEIKNDVLFRLSKQRGLVDRDDYSGVPYYLTVEDPYKTNQEKYPTPVSKKNDGLYVSVPGFIRLILHRDDTPLATFQVAAAQFGFVAMRDGSLFRHHVTHLLLNPITGAVERMTVEGK